MKTKLLRKIRRRYRLKYTTIGMPCWVDVFAQHQITALDTRTGKLQEYDAGRYDHPSFWVYSPDFTAVQLFVHMEIPFGHWIVAKNKRKTAKRQQLTKAARLFKSAVSGSALLLILLSACGSNDTQGGCAVQRSPIDHAYILGIERGRIEALKDLQSVAVDDSSTRIIKARMDSLITEALDEQR